MVTDALCFHCGQPCATPARWRSLLLGEARVFCCPGCQAVAQTIVVAGNAKYYLTREAVAPTVAFTKTSGSSLLGDLAQSTGIDWHDPLNQASVVRQLPDGQCSVDLALAHIRCSACLWLCERHLQSILGVRQVSLNYTTQRAMVRWAPQQTDLSSIIGALRAIGYDATPYVVADALASEQAEKRTALWQLFVAGLGAMQVMMYAFPAYVDDTGTLSAEAAQVMRWASLLLTVPVLIFSCGPLFRGAVREWRQHRVGMDTPIALGIGSGFAASVWATLSSHGEVYFDSITMLIFLLLVARFFERHARQRAARALDRMAQTLPVTATRIYKKIDGSRITQRLMAQALRVDDEIIIAPGETIAADGCVLSGHAYVDESLLTGESQPIRKAPGQAVIAGSLCIDQPLNVRVERVGAQTYASQLTQLIGEAAASRPHVMAEADRWAGVLTYVVLACALLSGLYWGMQSPTQGLWIAVAVLVVTCPCALALAAPLAISGALGALASRGVVLVRPAALQSSTQLTDVVLDKTGTLSIGELNLKKIHRSFDCALTDEAVLRLACALEVGSAHPVARALQRASQPAVQRDDQHAGLQVAQEIHHELGCGIEARIGARRYRIGTLNWARTLYTSDAKALEQLDAFPEMEPMGQTRVWFADTQGMLAALDFADPMRADATTFVADLHARGLRVHLLSGDSPSVVAAWAQSLSISHWQGGALPETKLAYLVERQANGGRVMMVGDGMNDAPVLARADVSVAMGQGAALAQRHADVVLVSGQLSSLIFFLNTARADMRIIRQNLCWAMAYNALALPLAMSGVLGPWQAALGMALSSVVVVINASRTFRFQSQANVAGRSI